MPKPRRLSASRALPLLGLFAGVSALCAQTEVQAPDQPPAAAEPAPPAPDPEPQPAVSSPVNETPAEDIPPGPTIEERLRRLETELNSVREENNRLRDDIGRLAGNAPAVKPAGTETSLAIGGLLQVQAEAGNRGDARFSTDNDRIYLRRARLAMSGELAHDFDFRVEVELAGSLAETTGMRAQMTDAFINWNRFDFANIRIGQFKTPYGYEQLASDPKLQTIERSLPNDRLTLGRQIGLQSAGVVYHGRIGYSTGLFNGTGINTNANDDDNFLWTGRLQGTPWESVLAGRYVRWSTGVNAYTSKDSRVTGVPADFGFDSTPATPGADNIFAGRRTGIGLDSQFHYGPIELWAEYLRTDFDQSSGYDQIADGWYLQSTFFAVPKTLQFLVKYDEFDPDTGVSGNSTDTWTFGINYFIQGDDLKIQLNYLLSDVPDLPSRQDKVLVRVQTLF